MKEFFRSPPKIVTEVIVIEVPPMMRKGEFADVIAIRHPQHNFTRFTNVPYVMGDLVDAGEGYEWGYGGCGPTNFAFNILLHFTDHDEAVTRAFHMEFRDEFLVNMPKETGRISKEDIFDFIEKMKVTRPRQLESVRRDMELAAQFRRAEIKAENRMR
jgi:hypothetical protein